MQEKLFCVDVSSGEEQKQIQVAQGTNLLDALRENGVPITAPCGGNGKCGKCQVSIEGGVKLACETEVEGDMTVEVLSQKEDDSFVIQVDYDAAAAAEPLASGECQRPVIAVDIGTTTVVLQMLDAATGRVCHTRSFLNGQRKYGADVVSRIQHASQTEGGLETLADAIRVGLFNAVEALCADEGIGMDKIEYIGVAGNTTMMYLLLELPCQSLGLFPFTPAFDIKARYTFEEVFGRADVACPVYLVPWVSAYVGGDITAGYLACCAGPNETALLVDMGTNGEMMLWSGEKVWCCSTAAGPAFEGGGISFGTGSIPGAISQVDLVDGKFACQTIGGTAPVGICGSGVLDAAACLLQGEFVDETGRMDNEHFKGGVVIAEGTRGRQIVFTQKDIRELQLAKAAVRAGVEILMEAAGITVDQLDIVYLAGGFGQKLRLESAVTIGLLPQDVASKARPSGNSSLGGCVRICRSLDLLKKVDDLSKNAVEVPLSTHPRFQNLFAEYMSFED